MIGVVSLYILSRERGSSRGVLEVEECSYDYRLSLMSVGSMLDLCNL